MGAVTKRAKENEKLIKTAWCIWDRFGRFCDFHDFLEWYRNHRREGYEIGLRDYNLPPSLTNLTMVPKGARVFPRKGARGSTSKYIGVSYNREKDRWHWERRYRGERIWGHAKSEEEAVTLPSASARSP